MEAIPLISEARIHQEVFIATLRSQLIMPGSKKKLASLVGITPQYLSYILAGDKIPSQHITEKIVCHLALSDSQRKELIDRIRITREGFHSKRIFEYISPAVADDLIDKLWIFHDEVTYSNDAALINSGYKYIQEEGTKLFYTLNISSHSRQIVKLCRILNNILCALNRHADALYFATFACDILESGFVETRRLELHEQPVYSFVHALRGKAMAYRGLGLYKDSYNCCLLAQQAEEIKSSPSIYKPDIFRDTISSLIGLPRFSISDAVSLAEKVMKIHESRANEQDTLWNMMIKRTLGNAYIAYGNLKKAHKLLRDGYANLNEITAMGPLHHVMFLESYAAVHWKLGDRDTWSSSVEEALDIARKGGLIHQEKKIRDKYEKILS